MLTDNERKRFADWLEEDARSNNLLIEQANKLPVCVGAVLARHLEEEATAEMIVAKKLRMTESQTI